MFVWGCPNHGRHGCPQKKKREPAIPDRPPVVQIVRLGRMQEWSLPHLLSGPPSSRLADTNSYLVLEKVPYWSHPSRRRICRKQCCACRKKEEKKKRTPLSFFLAPPMVCSALCSAFLGCLLLLWMKQGLTLLVGAEP